VNQVVGAVRASNTVQATNPKRVINLVVENMHCGSCMRTVEKTLQAQPGVLSARVNLSTKRATIEVGQVPVVVEAIIAALAGDGFAARPLLETTSQKASAFDPDLLRRLGVAGFAAANIMLISVAVWSGHAGDMPASLQTLFHWLSALIAIPAVAYAGTPFFRSARRALSARRLNMDVPISLGVLLATAMSLFQTMRGSEQVYFDAAVTLLFFLLAGRALDQAVRQRAAGAAENLLGRRASHATVRLSDASTARVEVKTLLPGMRLVVAAGEELPVDGRVVAGIAQVDESIITGESKPRTAAAGENVYGGSILLSGPADIDVIAVAENSLVAEIARLMQVAEQARGRYVRLADRAARFYAPAVHVLSAGTFIGWMFAGYGWEAALTAAIAVLIITCPCALALAVPAVQVVATSRLFRSGIVVKTADALERLAEIDKIVLDKTGTLTVGRPELSKSASIQVADLALAAGLAAHSRHPYAKAVAHAAKLRGTLAKQVSNVVEKSGAGLQGVVDGEEVRLGSAQFCGAERDSAEASLWFRRGTAPATALPMADQLRGDALHVIRQLQRDGYEPEVLSGDTLEAVKNVADGLDIACWRAAQTPSKKIAHIESLQQSGHRVLMVGDGLNDAPALAAGHASLSPASASDISQMASDAVFQGEGLAPVGLVLKVAKAARRRALENFAIAIGYNIIFVPLAIIGQVTPLIAAIAMSASSIAVTLNALRMPMGSVAEDTK
jgi:Cu2+-exporting ATPase